MPFLLAVGGWLYFGRSAPARRQIGWAIIGVAFIGVAFILISLRLIGEAAEPVRSAGFMLLLAAYPGNDSVGAFLLGAAMAFVLHSSVGAILVFVTFVDVGVLPVTAGNPLVHGANLGSVLIPVRRWRGVEVPVRRVPLGNLLLRGTASLAGLPAAGMFSAMPLPVPAETGQVLVLVHQLFNASLVVLFIPVIGFLERPLLRMLPAASRSETYPGERSWHGLEDSVYRTPRLALGSLAREVLHQGRMVESVVCPVMEIYRKPDAEQAGATRGLDAEVGDVLSDIRRFAASLQGSCSKNEDVRSARELAEFSFNLRSASDSLSLGSWDLPRTRTS